MAWYNKWALMTLAAALYTAAYNFATWSGRSEPDWGTWVGSIGTIFTLIGTIWLATSETRRRNREEKKLAAVTAAQMLFQILEVSKSIEACIDAFVNRRNDPRELCAVGADIIERAKMWTTQDLSNITALPNNVAPKLAICGADIDWCARALKLSNATPLQHPSEKFWEVIDMVSARLSSCKKTLGISQEVLTVFLVSEEFDGW